MSFSSQKSAVRLARERAKSANWAARLFFRSVSFSLTRRQAGRTTRVGVTVLSLLFFHFFPFLALTAYMSWEGFFSYDMFNNGVSGLTTFYWWAEIFLVVGSVYLTGAIYFVLTDLLKGTPRKAIKSLEFWFVLALNLLLFGLLFFGGLRYPDGFGLQHAGFLYLVCMWVVLHITILVHSTARVAIRSLMLGAALLCSLAALHPGTLALPYTLSLQYFGNGGGLRVVAVWSHSGAELEGKLVLASPNFIYLYPTGSTNLLVAARTDFRSIEIHNLSGFGHGKTRQ